MKSMILGSNFFFLRPETFEDIRTSVLNNRRVIRTAMFFREQFFINICVNSDRESKSSSDDSSKDDTIAEADAPCTTCCVCCPPKCCGAGLLQKLMLSLGVKQLKVLELRLTVFVLLGVPVAPLKFAV